MKKRLWLIMAIVLALVLAAILIWRLSPERRGGYHPPEAAYTPYPMDERAISTADAGLPEGLPVLKAETYSIALMPNLSMDEDGLVRIWFANNPLNRVYLMLDLRVADTNALLYRTGLIAPGFTMPALPLSPEAVKILNDIPGEVAMTLQVYSFALETYESMGEISLNLPLSK